MKNRGGEITDRFLLNFIEHQISRIEVSTPATILIEQLLIRVQTCATTLALRHMVRPFGQASLLEQACPMSDILVELQSQLSELQQFKDEAASQFTSA